MSNTTASQKVVKIGMVNYINTAPIYEIWKESQQDISLVVIEKPPSTLNSMLAAGEIDLGFVSSIEYSLRPSKYRILSDLSISASGPVGSVFLFSEVPIGALTGAKILLSNQSETSTHLLKIILEEFYSLQPLYSTGRVTDTSCSNSDAVMAIGDDALRLAGSGKYPFKLDLGEIWYNHIGLPFVFSVCVVRDDYYTRNKDQVCKVHEKLRHCRDEGQKNLRAICQKVASRIPMELDKCYSYLTALEYDLGEQKILALERFFTYLINRNEAEPNALPLKIVPALKQV